MTYHPPFIEPDMSNYYRLLREKSRRERVAAAFPQYTQTLDDMFENNPAVSSFLQAIPTQNIGVEEDHQGYIQPGVVPRGIKISNSITERKIFLKRIAEATLTGQEAFEDRELAKTGLSAYCAELGLDQDMADAAIYEVTRAADNMKRAKGFQIIPGGLKP